MCAYVQLIRALHMCECAVCRIKWMYILYVQLIEKIIRISIHVTKCVVQVLKLHSSLWSFILQPESDEEHFVDIDESLEISVNSADKIPPSGYQISARNPLYCKAEASCLWELNRLASHYHPSVQAFAKKIAAVSGRA